MDGSVPPRGVASVPLGKGGLGPDVAGNKTNMTLNIARKEPIGHQGPQPDLGNRIQARREREKGGQEQQQQQRQLQQQRGMELGR